MRRKQDTALAVVVAVLLIALVAFFVYEVSPGTPPNLTGVAFWRKRDA
jgi:hypothetical protein